MKNTYLWFFTLLLLLAQAVKAQKKHLLIQFSDSTSLIRNVFLPETSAYSITTTDASLNNTLNKYAITTFKKEYPSVHLVKHPKAAALNRVYRIDVADEDIYPLLNDINGLQSKILQGKIEVIGDAVPLLLPNDYSLFLQASFGCPVFNASNKYLDLINASAAWDVTTGNPNIRIAVSDQNFRRTHTEIVGKINLDNAAGYVGGGSHGTGVAVLAAGNTNNGLGIASIGYNCKVDLINIGDFNQMLDAAINGAKVINCSWLSSCSPVSYEQSVIDIIHDTYKTVIVAAAGNVSCGSANADVYPASYNHVISVSAVGHVWNIGDCSFQVNIKDVHLGDFTDPNSTFQHNANVDLCAPSWTVPFAANANDNNFQLFSGGTSISSPIVAGTAGLILSVNPLLEPDDVEAILKCTARDVYELKYNIPYLNKLGAGRINAGNAVQLAQTWVPGSATTLSSPPTDIKWFEILSDGINTIEVESGCATNSNPGMCNIGYRLEAVSANPLQTKKWLIVYSENGNFLGPQVINSIKYGNSITLTRGIDYPQTNVALGSLKACVRVNDCIPSIYYSEDRDSNCFGLPCNYPCNSDIIITGNYSNAITESSTWIKSTGQAIIADINNVKFDASPVNGYIELKPITGTEYFLAAPTNAGVFIAQAYNGCVIGTPSIVNSNGTSLKNTISNKLLEESNPNNLFAVYPNPSSGQFIVTHPKDIRLLEVFDLYGKKILNINTQGGAKTEINLSNLPSGMYILKADGQINKMKIVKQ
jgi:Subtilase family/Secretion system C-terminal sorting domain